MTVNKMHQVRCRLMEIGRGLAQLAVELPDHPVRRQTVEASAALAAAFGVPQWGLEGCEDAPDLAVTLTHLARVTEELIRMQVPGELDRCMQYVRQCLIDGQNQYLADSLAGRL
jgi:ATP/maltotriose-dependent transcriptional regulator MalT